MVAIEGEEGLLDDFRDIRPAQPASSRTLIEFLISEAFRSIGQSYPLEGFFRQAVGQPIGNELDNVLRVEVRQISAGMPTSELHRQYYQTRSTHAQRKAVHVWQRGSSEPLFFDRNIT